MSLRKQIIVNKISLNFFYESQHEDFNLNFINNLSLRYKLSLAVFGLVLPLIIIYTQYFQNQVASRDFSAKEIPGVELSLPIFKLQMIFADHRGTMNRYHSGDKSVQLSLANIRGKIREAIRLVDETNSTLNDVLSVKSEWSKLKSEIQSIVGQAESYSKAESFKAHSKVVAQLQDIQVIIADNSNLTLDPELATFYLMSMTQIRMPQLVEKLGGLRGYASGLDTKSGISIQEQDLLKVKLHEVGAFPKSRQDIL